MTNLPQVRGGCEGHRARQFANALDSLLFAETENMRWLRLASEKLERGRAIVENRRG